MILTRYFLIALLIAGFIGSGHSEIAEHQIRTKEGSLLTPRRNLTSAEEALKKEKLKSDIDYALANVNKPFADADNVRFPAWGSSVGYFTYGLIGGLYAAYGDREKSAKYYYKDYLQAMECARTTKSPGPISRECWGGTPETDINQLGSIIEVYEHDGDYKGALPYYKMRLEGYIKDIPGNSFEKRVRALRKRDENDANVKELREMGWTTSIDVIDGWEKAKKLAKTAKPKPLDPAVQNHEWFYSDKQEEVLRALGYYNKNDVRFMLEKALKHKDPVIAKKAKEYLDELGKADATRKPSEARKEPVAAGK